MYYLGTITGASGAYSNQTAGHSGLGTFTIPKTAKALYLVPSASGILFELGVTTGFQTTVSRGAQLAHSHAAGGWVEINGPFKVIEPTVTVSIYNNTGAFVSVRVYGAPTS